MNYNMDVPISRAQNIDPSESGFVSIFLGSYIVAPLSDLCQYEKSYFMKLHRKAVDNLSLRTLRENAGLGQKDVAKKLVIDQSTVSKWENGVAVPSRKYHKKLARMYGCTVEELLAEDGETNE